MFDVACNHVLRIVTTEITIDNKTMMKFEKILEIILVQTSEIHDTIVRVIGFE
jgi:ribosome-binding protein aMBF1 (putative translation factor)